MASTLGVRGFELVCVLLWLWGLWWVRGTRNPVYAGVYCASSLLMGFDWVFNTNWFFSVTYDEKFIPLWRVRGVAQPLALACNYAFYFGAPVLLLVHHRAWLDRKLGRWGYAAVFLVGGLADPLFEVPLVNWLKLWTYHQAPAFLLWGVPWSSVWYSGLLTVSAYGAARLAVRWAGALPAPGSGPAAGREAWWRGFAMGAASLWSAFYVSMLLQLIWYGLAQPWVPAPRPF